MAFSMNTNRRTAMSEINVTPLVDVMLVLLIIFMVTAPMMQEGVSLNLPQAKGEPLTKQQDVEPIIISVTGPGTIYVNDVPVRIGQLADVILADRAKNTSASVRLRADKNVPYGIVVQIMATLKNANIDDLEIETTPQQEEESAPVR